VWGGNGAQDGGFDCSGLTTATYRAAGITLPRTAHTQFHAGPHVPDGQPLLPGDLVFYGNPTTKIHHVGLYIGGGLMINAPTFGQPVQIEPYRYRGDDYAGATRPASSVAV
jgi:cell wall-associated NlpC family hydrolase